MKKGKKKSPQLGPILSLTDKIISDDYHKSNVTYNVTYDDLIYDFFRMVVDKRSPDFNLIVFTLRQLRQHLRT